MIPFARYIVASPDNLHLSYFDLRSLEWMNTSALERDVSGFTLRFARQAFEALTETVQTAVTVGVYNADSVQAYLDVVHRLYEHSVATVHAESDTSMSERSHCDCVEIPAYVQPTMRDGVVMYFRPARFGRTQRKQQHSGWECWSETPSHGETPKADMIEPR